MRLPIRVRLLCAILLAFLAGFSTQVFGQVFKEFPISSGSAPHGIVAGPDGAMWFTEYGGNRVARITQNGVVTEFAVPSGSPDRIALGPDGALWFTEPLSNMIGRITPAGVVDVFAVPTAGSSPAGITVGPDGALWFTEPGSNGIGRLTIAGAFTEFSTSPLHPNAIVPGPDDALWFTHGNGIGRITTAGVVSQVSAPVCGGAPAGIAAGPDGALWFTEPFNGRIGRITTAGVLREFRLGSNASPYEIVAGPDGAMWFTDQGNNLIGRISAGALTTNLFSLPFPSAGPSVPWGIAAGPDGAVWFTEEGRNRIGRITTGAPGAPPFAGCAPDATTLCLNAGRFKVQTVWTTSDRRSLSGQAVSLTGNTGYFWVFSPDNVELVVKVLNACTSITSFRFWVFAGGLTNLNVVLTVTDTSTGEVKIYSNPQGVAFQPIQDTGGFPCF